MILFTKWHDKLLAGLLVVFMTYFTAGSMYNVYEEIKEANIRSHAMQEKDPLTLISTDHRMQVLACGGTLELPRYTAITKRLTVTVQRKIVRVDSDIVDQEIIHLPDITYTDSTLGGRHITYTMIIPKTLHEGTYLYVPTLTYKVNKYLTITKPAASQVFKVVREAGCKS